VALLCCFHQAAADVVINEFLARNDSILEDPDDPGEYPDWIELYNDSTGTVDLTGWYLTDDADELDKWAFPVVSLNPYEFLVVFASNKDLNDPAEELHTNFKLTSDGEYLALVSSNGTTVVHEYSPNYPEQFADVSYGISTNEAHEVRYFATPSPGSVNTGGYLGTVGDTKFSIDRGFYTNVIQVAITTATESASIRYTLDGGEPTEVYGTVYSGPITISNTTPLRAMAYRTGYKSTDVDTQTYVFFADILEQPSNPGGFPSSWSGTTADYEMDPDIIDDPTYGPMMEESLTSIPTVSFALDVDDMFHSSSGIYANPGGRGEGWERSVSVEWFTPDGSEEFHINCGVRIYGGAFRGMNLTRKKSFRLLFKGMYGPSKLDFPMFPWDGDAATSYDNLVLRAGANDGWNNWGDADTQYIIDEYMRRTQLAFGRPVGHGRVIHLYINGLYWGIYNIIERPEASFCAEYFGGEKEEWDALNAGSATGEGNTTTWGQMRSQVNAGLADNASYQKIQGNNPDRTPNPAYDDLLDVENYIDYMFCNFWGGTGDWPGHNYYCACRRPPNATGFKWFCWDAEGAICVWSSLNANVTGVSGGAGEAYAELRNNSEFRLLFADQAHKHMFNGGAVTTNEAYQRYKDLSDEVEMSIVAESARWGDQRGGSPYTLAHWQSKRDYVLDTYMPQRTAIVVGQLKGKDLYPDTAAPVFNQHGGVFTNGFELTMTATEPVYYTLDGSDPREYETGSVLGAVYTGSIPMIYAARVKARARSAGGEWSALNEALFVPDWPSALRISEVMYNPREPEGSETNAATSADAFEFVEIQNTGVTTSGLAGVEFTDGIAFDFESGDVPALAPGESVVVVNDMAAFTNRYTDWSSMRIAGEYDGSLNDGGERVALRDTLGSNIVTFTYNDGRGWPLAADGAGHSLVPLVMVTQPDDALDYGGNWRAGTYMDGSPGEVNPAAITNVVINEITAHTDTGMLPPLDSDDWIELFNASASSITLADWYLSDSAGNLEKWQIPSTNMINAAGWLTFTERTGFNPDGTNGFGLNKAGEQVFLSHMPGGESNRVVDCVRFKGQENGRSLGRHSDGETYWYALTPTTNAANAAPVQEVVISELMYHPPGTAADPGDNSSDEYIEILNISGGQVDFWNDAGTWRVDGKSYTFPSNTSLAAGSSLLVVSFDPADPVALNTFLNVYGLTNGEVEIFGPYSGELSNRGERIALERPQAPDIEGDPASWVIVDEVIYFDRAPWPVGADGTGRALERTEVQKSGNDPANWQVGFWASPGIPTPVFRIDSPGYGDTLLLDSMASVQATVDVSRVVGSVDSVEFFLDGSGICIDTTEPYQCSFGPITNEGSHILSAVMEDGAATYTSRDVVVIGSGIYNEPGASGMTFSTAKLGGSFPTNAEALVYVYWGPDDGGTDKSAWSNEVALGTQRGIFAAPIEGLRSCETYYYRCYATNIYGDTWAAQTTNLLTLVPPVSLSLSGSPFAEDGGIANVTATLGNQSASNATVHLSFSGDAIYGTDYSASATTIVITAGSSSGSIALTGLSDPHVENPESAVVTIAGTIHSYMGSSTSVTASLISDDPMVENDGGATGVTDDSATLNGILTYGDNASIYIYWGTEDGGTNQSNWGAPRSLGSRGEGAFSDSVGGLFANQTYYYRCYAENAAGSDWADSTTNFTTAVPSVSIQDVVVTEGDSGSRNAQLTVVLSASSGVDVSVNYATADDTAEAGSDYQAVSGTLVIEAGDPTGHITVPVNGDAESEWPSEDFFVDLDVPTNCTIADARGVATISDDDVDVYLIDWKYRMKISFEGYGRDEVLDDFPALVVLNTNRENFAYSQFLPGIPSDLRFANSNLTSLLYYEIEDWNTNGDSVAWVQVPGIVGTNTYIWAYWGNPGATNPPAYTTNGATWNSDYRGVWHANETVVDSTSNGNDATADSSVSTEGAIAGGKSFNGGDQAITLGDLADFDLPEDLTLSAWVKPDPAASGEDCIFGKWGDSYMFSLNSRRPRFYIDGWRDANTTLTGSDWDLVTVTYDDTTDTVQFYLNGEADGTHNYNQNAGTSGTLYLGRRGGEWFQGDMDEFRMSDVVRSANWIWACWMNAASNDVFNLHGDVEAADENAPSIFNVYGATNVTDISAYLTARLTSTGTAETAVWVYWGTENGGETVASWANTNYFGPATQLPPTDYSTNVPGLMSNTVYSYAYRAANSNGTNWASGDFTTAGSPLPDNSGGATNIGIGMMALNGSLLLGNEAVVTIYWGPSNEVDDKDAWAEHTEIGTVYGNGSKFSADVAGLLYGVEYHYRCYATNGYGDGWSDVLSFLTPPPVGSPGELGLYVRCYNDENGDNYIDPITNLFLASDEGRDTNTSENIDYGSFTAFPGITQDDTLSMLWHGYFYADEDMDYSFGTRSDDGSVLFVDVSRNGDYADPGEFIVNNKGSHGEQDAYGDVYLEEGYYPIVMAFHEGTGGQAMRARWKKGAGHTYSSQDFINPDSGHFFLSAPRPGGAVGISNSIPTGLSATSATFNATLEGTGSVFDVSVYWGTSDGESNPDTWQNTNYVGSYTNVITADLSFSTTALASNSVYFYTFSAANAATNIWGVPSVQFVAALPDAPVVDNSAGATAIATGRATLNGMIVNGDAANAYICWQGGSDAGTGGGTGEWDNVVSIGLVNQDVLFSAEIEGMYYGLTYYYRCYVTNEYGMDWSEAMSFTTLRPSGTAGGGSTAVRINSSSDDAEELADGTMYMDSSDLEFAFDANDRGLQTVGMCFDNVALPDEGITITNAYVQFKADETYSADVTVTIRGEATDSASTFVTDANDISSRDKTTASSEWLPPPWNSTGAAGVNERTPDLSDIITEIVERPGWLSGNSLAIFIGGTEVDDRRTAESYNGDSGGAPQLNIFWATNVTTLAITNTGATDIHATSASFSGLLEATTAVFHVWAYWGESNSNRNPSGWADHAYVGSYTNGSFALSYTADGLVDDTTYYYTFMASNAVETMWATSSVSFTTDVGDSDGDGMLDEWEVSHFEDMDEDGSGDADSDGSSDLSEFVAGTDPTNALSKLQVETIDGDEPYMVLHWSSVSNRIYSIWGSTNILTNDWWNIDSNIPAVPPLNIWTVTPSFTDFEFYRIGVERE
jgi:hypothetical protein